MVFFFDWEELCQTEANEMVVLGEARALHTASGFSVLVEIGVL